MLSGLSKYGMPTTPVGAIISIPLRRALAVICPRTLSKSILMVSRDQSLLKSMALSKDTSKVSHLIFSFKLRSPKSPALDSKKTSNGFGRLVGIGLSKVKIGLMPKSASATYLSHETTVNEPLMTIPVMSSLSLVPSK